MKVQDASSSKDHSDGSTVFAKRAGFVSSLPPVSLALEKLRRGIRRGALLHLILGALAKSVEH